MNTRVKAMLNFAYFCSNYPSDFIEKAFVNHPDKIKHIKSKFADAYASAKAVGAVVRFVHELDETNQAILLDWIDDNYTAFESSKVKSFEDIEADFKDRYISLGINPKSKRFGKLQAEFFAGASSALEEFPPLWYFSILRGDNICEERARLNLKKVNAENESPAE